MCFKKHISSSPFEGRNYENVQVGPALFKYNLSGLYLLKDCLNNSLKNKIHQDPHGSATSTDY